MKKVWIAAILAGLLVLAGACAGRGRLDDITGHPYEQEIRHLLNRSIITGYPDGTFRPDRLVTRAEYVVMLDRAYLFAEHAGAGVFLDVPAWAAAAAERARAMKVTAGVGEGRFDPHSHVTLEQAVVMLVRTLTGERNLQTDGTGLSRFDDGNAVSPQFREAMEWAAWSGLLGEGGMLRPRAPATRARVARLLVQAQQRFPLITVIGLNETHGGVEPVRDRNSERLMGGAAAFARYLADRRTKNPGRVVLIDTGDSMQETMISNLSQGRVVVEVFNALGLDASTIGNHEWDWGEQVLRQRIAEANYPYLAVNIFRKADGTRPEFLKTHTVLEREGFRIGLVAATIPETPTITLPAHVEPYRFEEPVVETERFARNMRRNVDLLIGFGHLGIEPGGKTGAMLDLARAVPGVDAWFAGHIPIEMVVEVNGAPVIQGGKGFTGAAEVNFVLDARTRTVRNRWASVRRIWVDQWQSDPAVEAIVARYRAQVEGIAREVLVQSRLDLKRDRHAESNVGNWVTDIMRAKTGTEVAITNGGGIRIDIPAGPVTYGQLYTMLPFDNHLVTMKLTGAQLKDALENGVSEKHSLIQVSGLTFRWDGRNPVGQRVLEVRVGGRPLEMGRLYTVTTQNFMATGGDGYHLPGTDVVDLPVLQRDAVIEFARVEGRAGRIIEPRVEGRIVRVDR